MPIFVDVDGDLAFTPAVDIGPGAANDVDIRALILADGKFNTQQNEGAYRAPQTPASLVIPETERLDLTVPVDLKAGLHLVMRGMLSAPSISLRSGNDRGAEPDETRYGVICQSTAEGRGSVDLTNALCGFATKMQVTAGADVYLDGAGITGWDLVSALTVNAGRDISVMPTAEYGASLGCTTSILLDAARNIAAGDAYLGAYDPLGYVKLIADETVTSAGGMAVDSAGKITVQSNCASVRVEAGSLYGQTVVVNAETSIAMSGTSVYAAGAFTANAGCALDLCSGTPATITAGSMNLKGASGVEARNLFAQATAGTCSLNSSCGPLAIDDAYIQSAAGFTAHAETYLSAARAWISANDYARLYADRGAMDASGSTIAPFDPVADPTTSITAQSRCDLNAADARWGSPARINIKSTEGNVHLERGAFDSPRSVIRAFGLDIYVTEATGFSGTVSYGPSGYQLVIVP